jgi:hypothetical protein
VTESEWLACTHPEPMLKFLRGKASERKLRLFICACSRRKWDVFAREEYREAIRVAENFADGNACKSELTLTHVRLRSIHFGQYKGGVRAYLSSLSSAERARVLWSYLPVTAVREAGLFLGDQGKPATSVHLVMARELCPEEDGPQAELLRDIFGNPFRPATFDPAWLTPTVTSLALAAYDERSLPSGELDKAGLAVLADALEDVGCQDAEILGHCRQVAAHVRGCWVVDLLLGKE